MANQAKINQVNKLTETLKENKNFVLVKFLKTKHQALEALKKELKKNDAVFKVIKNTLLEKAFSKISHTSKIVNKFSKNHLPLKEPTALLLLKKDWSNGLKAFYEFCQKEKGLSFKSGIIDDITYSDAEVLKISQLPGKNLLVGKVISSIKSPADKFVYSLKYNTNKLVYLLQQISKKVN